MTKSDFENKSLILIILVGYILNLLLGWIGFFNTHGSGEQMMLFQIGSAFAISACVMAARYVGLRGQQVAASAYILLGITHGISLAALSRSGINLDREATMAMPMVPGLLFMFWCNLYPKWLRGLAIMPCILFTLIYINVQSGESHLGWILYSGYAVLQIIEVLWGIYIFKDWKQSAAQNQN